MKPSKIYFWLLMTILFMQLFTIINLSLNQYKDDKIFSDIYPVIEEIRFYTTEIEDQPLKSAIGERLDEIQANGITEEIIR